MKLLQVGISRNFLISFTFQAENKQFRMFTLFALIWLKARKEMSDLRQAEKAGCFDASQSLIPVDFCRQATGIGPAVLAHWRLRASQPEEKGENPTWAQYHVTDLWREKASHAHQQLYGGTSAYLRCGNPTRRGIGKGKSLNWFPWPIQFAKTLLYYIVFQCLLEIDKWGIDIFRIGDLSNNRPLTAVAYQAFQVSAKNCFYRSGV